MEIEHHLDQVMAAQQNFYLRGQTREYGFRVQQLGRLRAAIHAREAQILGALKADLGKPETEGFVGEVGFIYAELGYTLRHLKSWMKPKRVATPLPLLPSSSYVLSEPLGETLIISPWNYPFQLLMAPLIGAMAAGNVAVLKPSELAPRTAAVIQELITATFPAEYVAVVSGGPEVVQAALRRKWDHIFFTGSTPVGRIVAKAAAEHLTPVTLELGGKSPCIVDRETDLDISARRIVWGKFYNAGQTCVAPDYLLVHESVKRPLLERMQHHLREFYGPDPARSEDYARIVSHRHFDRLAAMLDEGEIVVGGQRNRAERYVAPTICAQVPLTARVMQEEIFGPILPVLEYRTLDEAIGIVRQFPKPLALYVFTKNRATRQRLLAELSFGGGCINDTLVHLSNPELPFGGVGLSGVGAYHGQYSFDTFSHRKSIVRGTFLVDLKLRYQPYKGKLKWLRMIFK